MDKAFIINMDRQGRFIARKVKDFAIDYLPLNGDDCDSFRFWTGSEVDYSFKSQETMSITCT